jgi:hypothetical protein
LKSISIEVVTRVLTTYGHCVRCEPFFHESGVGKKSKIEDVKKYPPDLIEESSRLSELICELYQIYKHRIRVRLIDVQSPLGIYKSLIHRFREYPAFIVEKQDVYKGWDKHKLEEIIDKHIKAAV